MSLEEYNSLSESEKLGIGEGFYVEIMQVLKENFDLLDEKCALKVLEDANKARRKLENSKGVFLNNACITLESILFNLRREVEKLNKFGGFSR